MEGNGKALRNAARVGDLKVIKSILQRDKKALDQEDDAGYSALHHAAFHGQVAVIRFLLNWIGRWPQEVRFLSR